MKHRHIDAPDTRSIDGTIAELVAEGSIELSAAQDLRTLPEARALLPAGMGAYIASLPKQTLMFRLERMRAVHAAGYDPVPHLAARRIPSKQELQRFLRHAVEECGVHRALVIGGDVPEPAGPYADAAAILRDGILAETGVREVGLAGYPEGHPRIPARTLHATLEDKLKLAREQGLGTYIVTQFSFAPLRIIEYCASMARTAPDLPIYVGMPGPTSPSALVRYARNCGVSTSLRALIDLGFKAAKLVRHTTPEEQLVVLGHHCAGRPACNVVGVHIYSFGGFLASAKWMHQMYANPLAKRTVPG